MMPPVGGAPAPAAPSRSRAGMAEAFVRSYPVMAASAGVTYRFDPLTGAFDREAAMVGQLFLERAEPIGRGHWNVGLSYQRVALDSIEGRDASALSDDIPIAIVDDQQQVVGLATFDQLSVDAVTHVATLSVTYGVTDAADLNLTVPVIVSDLSTEATASGVNLVTGEFATVTERDSETSVGFGDVILRGRYRLVDLDLVKLAAGLVLRFPSGDVDALRGTGVYEVAPLFGIEGDRPDYYDFSVGGRVNLWRDTLIAFANAVIPLNDAGIRTEVIPLVGAEVTF